MGRSGQTLAVGAALTLSVTLATAAIALAAAPKKGATYAGTMARSGDPLTLKVSRSGKTVTVDELFAPAYCHGGAAVAGEQPITKPAPISGSGVFSAVISYESVRHRIASKLYVKGVFDGRNVKGTARSEFLLAPRCDGSTTFSATTR